MKIIHAVLGHRTRRLDRDEDQLRREKGYRKVNAKNEGVVVSMALGRWRGDNLASKFELQFSDGKECSGVGACS